jgi:hypothetical protein
MQSFVDADDYTTPPRYRRVDLPYKITVLHFVSFDLAAETPGQLLDGSTQPYEQPTATPQMMMDLKYQSPQVVII